MSYGVSLVIGAYCARLTPGRVRGHALVLFAGLWIASAWNLATPGLFDRNGILKGIDFLQFYVAGRLVGAGRGDSLYDWPAFARDLSGAVHGLGDTLFLSVYPPTLAVLFAPLGQLQYGWALLLWTIISAALYAFAVGTLFSSFPALKPYRGTYILAAAGFVPFQQVLLHGQIGCLVLGLLVVAWQALRRERLFWAGVALGLLLIKPQFGSAVVLAFLCTRSLRLLAGAIAGALTAVVISLPADGLSAWAAYGAKVPVIIRTPEVFEPKVWQMHNLKGAVALLLGTGGLATAVYLVLTVAIIALLVRLWARITDPDLRMAALVLAAMLINPHMYVYDLVVVAVPLVTITAWTLRTRDNAATQRARVLVHALCWVPLLGPLAAATRVQLTAPLLAALLWTVYDSSREPSVQHVRAAVVSAGDRS